MATAADDLALIAFTSGTTGRPKATPQFHRDVLANADSFSRHALKPTGTPPLAFTFGLGGLVVFPFSGQWFFAKSRTPAPPSAR